jgi:glutamate synthase (NADPH/NADH) small chain
MMAGPGKSAAMRPAHVRVRDWQEIGAPANPSDLQRQAGRCMDCGIAFCHGGCPLGNVIPEWNELTSRGRWRQAAQRLDVTNNFPEFTGRLCPAPCESACVLGIADDPVAIKQIEAEIADEAWARGWVTAQPPTAAARAAGRPVAVIGSGPAGLAAAQQLTRAGHAVTVFEQDDLPGGLLRYGIPDFKLEKWRLDRRLDQLRAEGTTFACRTRIGTDVFAAELRTDFAAVILACGAPVPRDLPVPGAGLTGIHWAMEYLTLANRQAARERAGQAGPDEQPPISARGRDVMIIGGGDTGADCLGTALRQGARSVTQLEHKPTPPQDRPPGQPWPGYPLIYRVTYAHEEGGERLFAVSTQGFLGDGSGRVRALHVVGTRSQDGRLVPLPGTERELGCDLVLLAMGFRGAEDSGLLADLGLAVDARGRVARGPDYATTSPGVFVAGDMGRGQSLIVWAIAEGRSAAAAADRYLSGRSDLPVAIAATARPFGLLPG